MSNSTAHFKQSANSVLKLLVSQYPSVRPAVITPPELSVCVMVCRIKDMGHTAVGVALVRRSSGFLAFMQRDEVGEFECAGTDYSAGKSSKVDRTHNGIKE